MGFSSAGRGTSSVSSSLAGDRLGATLSGFSRCSGDTLSPFFLAFTVVSIAVSSALSASSRLTGVSLLSASL